jgi:uncharacterized membrane protein (DUF485 family)
VQEIVGEIMSVAVLIGLGMIIAGLALTGIVIWRSSVFRRRDKQARSSLDD